MARASFSLAQLDYRAITMTAITEQLERCHPDIEKLLALSGAPGLSLGVLHHGQVIHTAHFGRRNASEPAPPNDDTIYWMLSMTKVITATAISELVHAGQLSWDLPIRDYLPQFRIRQDDIGLKATLKDLLSMRTGLTPENILIAHMNGEAYIRKEDVPFIPASIGVAKPFREGWVYSQWNYTLVADVVEAVTGVPLCDYIQKHIFQRLGMPRSSFSEPSSSESNAANAHGVLDNGNATCIPNPCTTEVGLGPAGGLKGSIKDYLIFLQALLSSYKYSTKGNGVQGQATAFSNPAPIFEPLIGFGPPGRSRIDDAAYCMGLYRTRLPGFLSVASPNWTTLGRKRLKPFGTSPELRGLQVYHHAATLPGSFGAMYMVPSSQIAVVVMTNAQPLFDAADFSAQMLLSVLLGEQDSHKYNFLQSAETTRSMTLDMYTQLALKVEEGKTQTSPSHPLRAYEGDYFNTLHNLVLSVSSNEEKDALELVVQGRKDKSFPLLPYDGDTFYWPVDREEEVIVKAMWPFDRADWHKITFASNDIGIIERLIWRHDPYVVTPGEFRKVPKPGVRTKL